MKVLLTGFEPFDGESINPALEACKLVDDQIADIEIIKLEVPTVFNEAIQVVVDKINEVKPDVVFSIGQAGGRFDLTVERVAINLNDARMGDNKGVTLMDTKINEEGPDAYFSTLPTRLMVEKMKENNIPASLSYSAGTFVCNHLMYGVLDYIQQNHLPIKAGFMHVPYIPAQTVNKYHMPSLPLEMIVQGITTCIKAFKA